MGCKPYPHHCPSGSGGPVAVLGLVAAGVLAVVVGQAVASVFVALMVTGGMLGAIGIAHLAYVLHRDRWQPAEPRDPAPAPGSSQGHPAADRAGHPSAAAPGDRGTAGPDTARPGRAHQGQEVLTARAGLESRC
jgi:hypothetical protein